MVARALHLTGSSSPPVSLVGDLFRNASATAEEAPHQVAGEPLYAEELEPVRRSSARRRSEFEAGRRCVRRAAAAMGIPPFALPARADRSPVWPPGIVGSISHTADYCAVVLARSPPVLSIGLDVEDNRPFDPDVIDRTLTARERASFHRLRPRLKQQRPVLIFSAKEAYYKCQFPISGMHLDFQEVEIEIFESACSFEVRASQPRLPESVRLMTGTFRFREGKVLCGVELLHSS